ncbi:hypothetical protein COCC4DRAFT_37344 [Bipolaris maydis ATCC 48331]|uniref:Uncharacterized protein n=2 Tax=Cochliobolus heterostrophus TaxID=5016 RepID=M2TZ83_COCH5|nr:uncharacterized protein COCC4DRAFT_37344 [Bipolaris maydis ATCC 48331]EMD91599.1 hypothetical protein COCHEDRAFT_1214028 [Bipolaris maydis C5]KAH7559418.1 hypothetical protein BM1_04355 [Bipolaris maydis]ENI08644.1 hypothetical protein COCC4DRAFT_37344 [Bipolaris maydis ATCC 48331]KAJ5027238.1 hypothetical protein J3E73DRAFT_410009 [Bipolaris maydis]KAJ5058988.1 hypothetical protein J3E74DRAFT_455367 [Bipolaris maydis]
MSSTKSPAANPSITPDPAQDGSTIRKAFILEATANLFTIPLITNTRFTLSLLLSNPSRDINPASVLFARLFGGLIVGGLTSALFAGAANTRNGIESRRPTYLMLGIGEACLIPILMWELIQGAPRAAISRAVAGVSIGFLLPPLLWRMYVLFVRPELLGRYIEEREDNLGADGRGGYGSINTRDD